MVGTILAIVVCIIIAAIIIAPIFPVKDDDGTWTTLWDYTDTAGDC